MCCCLLGEMCVKVLFAGCEEWQAGALGRSALDGKMPVFLKGAKVREDRLDSQAKAAHVVDELEASSVNIAPVDQCVSVPHPGDAGIVDDAESVAMQDDRARMVIRDGVPGFLVLAAFRRAGTVGAGRARRPG